MKPTIYESDGSDGYTPGTYGYTIETDDGRMWCDGGHSGRDSAIDAARAKLRWIDEHARTEEQWWAWHSNGTTSHLAPTQQDQARCDAWVAHESNDGPRFTL